ncbi:MAG: ABC transporter ATP-binding protein [Gemmatimonadales bacterium]
MSLAIAAKALRKIYPAPKPRRGPRAAAAPFGAPPVAPPGAGAGREIVALDSLDLEVEEGEFFGLLGPNGAGKSTTIGVLTTRVRPSGGSALVMGVDVVADPVGVKRRIGVVPQRPNPDRSLTARQNLLFHADYFGIPRSESTRRAEELLTLFGIADRAESRVNEMSGGQQQRLMLVRALMHQPNVLFLDEPTVGLDPQARLALWEILRRLHAEGRTIVMTTHYMEEADQLCDRVGIVDHGRLLACDTTANLKAKAPGGTLIVLTLDGPAADLTGLAAGSGILGVDVKGDALHVFAERAGEVIPGLIRAAEQAGRQVRDIHLSPPSLETLFVSMTGRSLQ